MAQYISLSNPLIFTFYVVTVMSKNTTKMVHVVRTVFKKPSLVMMMEAGKWKTTREVTSNTCNPQHHLEEFIGSRT